VSSETIVPDIGDTFTHNDRRYRVDGWLKRMARPEPPAWDRSPRKDMLDDLLYEAKQRVGPDRERLIGCVRKEAEYVSGYGIAGCIVRVADVRVTGRVAWFEAEFEHARHEAACMVGRPIL
jgi:hypothetical protein